MFLASIIFMSLPTNYYGVFGARLLAGFAFGCSYLTSLMYISEISSPAIRVQNLFLIHISITLGMLLHACFTASGLFLLTGSVSIVLTALSVPIGYFWMLPSPHYMMQNHSRDTIERILYFSNEKTVTDKMHLEADIVYNHVIKENKRSFNFCSYHNTTSLAIVIFVKIGYLSTFNIVHNFLRSLFMRAFLLEFTEPIALASRLLGAIFGFFILDRISKKWHFAIPLFTIAAILIAFGCLLTFELVNYIWTPLAFFFPLEFLTGIGVGGMSEILKAEIFPFRERKASMAFSYFVEEIVHILSIITHYGYVFTLGSNPSFWPFIFAPFAIISGIFVVLTLKDSRKESLKDVSMVHSEETVVVTPTS